MLFSGNQDFENERNAFYPLANTETLELAQRKTPRKHLLQFQVHD